MLKGSLARLSAALVFVAFLLCSAAWSATSPWGLRPGCIGYLTSTHMSEGSEISLDDIVVIKISAKTNPAYIVCSEMFRSQDKIVILTSPSPLLRLGQSIDCSGILTKLDGNQLAVTSPTIIAYTTATGDILYSGLIKGIDKPTPWAFKRDITVAESTSSMRTMSAQSSMPGDPPTTTESVVIEACDTIAEAKAKTAGTAVRLQCKPVASVSSGYFMLGQDDSTDTMKAYYTKSVLASNRVCSITAMVQTEGTEKVLDIDSGPSYDEQIFVGSVTLAAENTIGYAKSLQDGASITLGTSSLGKIVTCALNSSTFYIEEDDRASGIRVVKSSYDLLASDRAYFIGTMATNSNGERYIQASTVSYAGHGLLRPIGMNNKSMGGGDFFYNSDTPISGQRGITGASGLNNIGLLIRVWGKVKSVDTGTPMSWFKIDDGSGVDLKIDLQTSTGNIISSSIAVNDYIYANGISSCEVSGANLLRVLRPGPVVVPTYNCNDDTYSYCLGVTIKSAMLGDIIRYTTDSADPDTSSMVYDPAGVAVVGSSLTLKSRVYRDSWVTPGSVKSHAYSIDDEENPTYPDYNCWDYEEMDPVNIYDFRLKEIEPGIMSLDWRNAPYNNYDVQRNTEDSVQANQSEYADTFSYTLGTSYTYKVRAREHTDAIPSTLLSRSNFETLHPGVSPIPQLVKHWPIGEWKTITVVPQKVVVSENQAVDSRTDTRYIEDVPVNFQFGSRVYRGGLFAGFANDPSKVGRSFLKFDLSNLHSNMGANDRLWTGRLSAYYTRSAVDTTTTQVTCLPVGSNWNASSVVWNTAPSTNITKTRETINLTGSTPSWCIWKSLFADVASGLYAENNFSAALVSTSETSPGWAYFAKKEYDTNLAPNILCAYGKYENGQSGVAPVFPASVDLDRYSIKGGNTVKAYVRLNAPAPTGGITVSLGKDDCSVYFYPTSATIPAGKLEAEFLVSTAIVSSDTTVTLTSGYGSSATLKITHD